MGFNSAFKGLISLSEKVKPQENLHSDAGPYIWIET